MDAPTRVSPDKPQMFRVTVRLEAIRRHLSAADRTGYSAAYVRQWLTEAGFKPVGDAWLVDEANLGHLDPSEVADIAPA